MMSKMALMIAMTTKKRQFITLMGLSPQKTTKQPMRTTSKRLMPPQISDITNLPTAKAVKMTKQPMKTGRMFSAYRVGSISRAIMGNSMTGDQSTSNFDGGRKLGGPGTRCWRRAALVEAESG